MFDVKNIENRKKNLLSVGEKLKGDFIGLDDVIDKIISSIEVWYTFPELLTHPLIVNLWGMTGVGKTDLIRKLVSYLDFRDRYLEVQLTAGGGKWDTIQSKILGINISSTEQSILLLDEIQRFQTIDGKGELIRDGGYADVWELLSDGSFSDAFQEKYELQMYLYELLYDQDRSDSNTKEEVSEAKEEVSNSPQEIKKVEKERKFKNYIWTATKFKKLTESPLSIDSIMQLSIDEQINIINDKLAKISSNQVRKKYNNLLIFVCGNIDEAYSMSSDVSEVDVDADILHERTKKISILDIKKSLLEKFKPEQIARLGNNHIIYSSLSKNNFKDLIYKRLENIKSKFFEVSNIKVSFDPEIYDIIYKNGVFPTQGVRPVFSTITNLIENALPEFILRALKENITHINLSFDKESSSIYCSLPEHKKKVSLEIDRIKGSISENSLSLISVHEVGHVLAYMLLFKVVPAQVCCDAVNFAEGFVIPHDIRHSKESLLNQIKVLLGGKAAEEMVFGDSHSGPGSSSDIASATFIASNIVRVYNMGDSVGRIVPYSGGSSCQTIIAAEETDKDVESILIAQKKIVSDLLLENKGLFKILAKELRRKKKLLSDDIFELSLESIPDLKQISLKETVEYDYSKGFDSYFEEDRG